jgi:hypothetical protein
MLSASESSGTRGLARKLALAVGHHVHVDVAGQPRQSLNDGAAQELMQSTMTRVANDDAA